MRGYRTRAVAENSDITWIPAESEDVFSDPIQRGNLVLQALIPTRL